MALETDSMYALILYRSKRFNEFSADRKSITKATNRQVYAEEEKRRLGAFVLMMNLAMKPE